VSVPATPVPGRGRVGILLANLGTPAAATTPAVRRYLAQFLWDRRVVEIPRLPWWFILHLFILPFRPARSAAKYASIWTSEGSPLLAISLRQRAALEATLRTRGLDVEVALGMRYAEPSMAAAWAGLRRAGVGRILVVPLYPQYSATTIASTIDSVCELLAGERDQPELRTVRGFADHPGYIRALAQSVRAHWAARNRPDRLVMSFHGLPQRNVDLGDPYFQECHVTARRLGEALGLDEGGYEVAFQSRFGPARWLEPATAQVLTRLAQAGVGRVDVVCPGFAADCLETLEEIAIEGRLEFISHGGKELCAIACLNDSPAFIEALAELVGTHTQGWPLARSEK
jgi:ferrochelatase